MRFSIFTNHDIVRGFLPILQSLLDLVGSRQQSFSRPFTRVKAFNMASTSARLLCIERLLLQGRPLLGIPAFLTGVVNPS